MKNKQKEWHPATKPLKKKITRLGCLLTLTNTHAFPIGFFQVPGLLLE
jgi:hypothetical protein